MTSASWDMCAPSQLVGIEMGETVIAPGVEDAALLPRAFDAEPAAFHGQSPQLASRYRSA